MGQYYRFVALNNGYEALPNNQKVRAFADTFTFGCGAKLIEFSYIGNRFVRAVEMAIEKGKGQFAGLPILFAGDYAKEECGDGGSNIYYLTRGVNHANRKILAPTVYSGDYHYLINETKGLFIDLTKIKDDEDGWAIHPLPLLCCEGNGKGGGDYFGKSSQKDVGTWARDVVVTSNVEPPKDKYKEVSFHFKEN